MDGLKKCTKQAAKRCFVLSFRQQEIILEAQDDVYSVEKVTHLKQCCQGKTGNFKRIK